MSKLKKGDVAEVINVINNHNGIVGQRFKVLGKKVHNNERLIRLNVNGHEECFRDYQLIKYK